MMDENPYSSLKMDPAEEAGQAPTPTSAGGDYAPNPYTKVKNELSIDDTLQQNPAVADHLSNWAKFSGHGIVSGLVEDLGLPIDTINSANDFIKNYPAVASHLERNPFVGPLLMGAQAAQAIKGDDKPIYTGSTAHFKNIAERAGLPTSTPEQEGVTDWAASLGANIGEFAGANLPFAALGVAKEATSVGTSLARKAWNVFYHEAVPAVSIGSGAFIGEEVIPGDEGKTIGAVAGLLRLSAVKAAFSGVRSAKDWVKSLYSAEPRVARNISEAASDLPKAVEQLDKQPELSPGAEVPVDIQTEDPGLIALVRTVRDKDRDLAGLYDQQYQATEDAILADKQFSRASFPDTATYLRAKTAQWSQLVQRRAQQAVEEAKRAFDTAVGNAIPSEVDATKFKNLQSTLARQYLLEARDDMHAVTEAKWAKVDKAVPVSMDPVYDELNSIRKEHKERPGESDARFPGDVVDRFFENAEIEEETPASKPKKLPHEMNLAELNARTDEMRQRAGMKPLHEKKVAGGEETKRFGPGARLQDAIDLDSEIQQEIRQVTSDFAPDRVRLAYLTRISKALQGVKSAAPGGETLKEANAATKEFHQTFSRGPVGNILGHDEPGYPRVTPGETIDHVISQGSGGIDAFGAFMRAVSQKAGEGNAPAFLEKYLRQDFYTAAMPQGQFNRSRAQQWLRNNTGPLAHPGFENLRREVEDAIKSQGESVAAAKAETLSTTKLKQHAVSLFLNDPGRLFGNALHSTEQFSETRKLLDLTEGDSTGKATDGLVQMAFDRMIKDSIVQDHLTPEMQHVNGKAAHDWFERNDGVIKALDTARPGVAARFKRIAETARKNELHRLSPKIPGVSEKAATLALNDIVARITGAKVFTRLFGGHGGSSIQIASIGSQAFKKWAAALKPDDAIRILGEAMTDPKLFKALVKSINDEKEMAKAIQVFEPYWASMQIPLIQSALTQPMSPGTPQPKKLSAGISHEDDPFENVHGEPPKGNVAENVLNIASMAGPPIAAFAKGGLTGLAKEQGMQQPAWSERIANVLQSSEANTAFGMAGSPEFLAPPSKNVAKAITRVNAWIKEKEKYGEGHEQPALLTNIRIMMRGGPMAEKMAKHMLDTFEPHPSESLPPKTIEHNTFEGQ
jgi:hypothetical protein